MFAIPEPGRTALAQLESDPPAFLIARAIRLVHGVNNVPQSVLQSGRYVVARRPVRRLEQVELREQRCGICSQAKSSAHRGLATFVSPVVQIQMDSEDA